jgi:N-acetylglucosaminyldiphosphoundecaprenol N-acetyl-beta-D-mannosaminyltransferase
MLQEEDLMIEWEAALAPDTTDRSEPRIYPSHLPTAPPAAPPTGILGVVFDNVTVAQALQRIDDMIVSRQPHYVVTANVDFLAQARSDTELRRVLLEAHLVLCDGTPLVWASRFLGNPLPERVAGSDLMPCLLGAAAEKGYRLFFLGATPEANEQAVANVRTQFPGIEIAGYYSPPFRPLLEMDNQEIERRIRAARPDILLVAFGCPKAEKWMAMNYRRLGLPVTIGVGATIDFLAGRVKRAPLWMRRGGVEWVFRLCQEPRRLFKRYVADLWIFTRAIVAQLWVMKPPPLPPGGPAPAHPVFVEPTWKRVQAPEHFTAEAVKRAAATWGDLGGDGRDWLLELGGVKFLDSTGAAFLYRLQSQLRAQRRHLILLSPSDAVRRVLALMRWEEFFEMAHDGLDARELILAREDECRAHVLYGARRVLVWRGEITAANASEFWTSTRKEISSKSAWRKLWTIDLSQVRFVDSAGAQAMRRLKEYAERLGAQLRFAHATPTVRNVLRRSRLEAALLDGES